MSLHSSATRGSPPGGELTVMVNVRGAEASPPPFAVPPLSVTITEVVVTPNSPAAGAYCRLPSGAVCGGLHKEQRTVGRVLEPHSLIGFIRRSWAYNGGPVGDGLRRRVDLMESVRPCRERRRMIHGKDLDGRGDYTTEDSSSVTDLKTETVRTDVVRVGLCDACLFDHLSMPRSFLSPESRQKLPFRGGQGRTPSVLPWK